MAIRPIFIARDSGNNFVDVDLIEFKWHPGMATSQKKKNVLSLHESAKTNGYNKILEVSSKSQDEYGIKLSAFNLSFRHQKRKNEITVESAFQGSKVFSESGPFHESYYMNAKDARHYVRENTKGQLIGFDFFGERWPLTPTTLFYNWIYINSLYRCDKRLVRESILEYDVFTDIEFNPKKSINCQAYSVALYVSLYRRSIIEDIVNNKEKYIKTMKNHSDWVIDSGLIQYHSKHKRRSNADW